MNGRGEKTNQRHARTGKKMSGSDAMSKTINQHIPTRQMTQRMNEMASKVQRMVQIISPKVSIFSAKVSISLL